jgi:hypothetical protein
VAPTLGNALSSARVFLSGHSLMDDPLGEFMSSIAQSLSTPMVWNEQIVLGSPIRVRTRGDNAADASFSGYRKGKNRGGSSGLNVAAELANPQTLGGQRYDTLLLTERHDLASVLLWEDTVRYTRHFHERLITGNARANSYLYHSWLEVKNKSDPSAWINYERAAAPAWQCVAARVNQSLAGEGRGDRMAYLPAGLALANLVEQATRTGVYYMALVSYASVYRRSPVGAWAPAEVSAQQARALQDIAWQSVANHYNSASTPSMSQCQATMREQYCSAFASYKGGTGMLSGCIGRFTEQTQNNPLYYSAGSDAGYWLPAPR